MICAVIYCQVPAITSYDRIQTGKQVLVDGHFRIISQAALGSKHFEVCCVASYLVFTREIVRYQVFVSFV